MDHSSVTGMGWTSTRSVAGANCFGLGDVDRIELGRQSGPQFGGDERGQSERHGDGVGRGQIACPLRRIRMQRQPHRPRTRRMGRAECGGGYHQEPEPTPSGEAVLQGEDQPQTRHGGSGIDECPPQREAEELQGREVVIETHVEHGDAEKAVGRPDDRPDLDGARDEERGDGAGAEPPRDSLATLLIGGAALVLLFFVLCYLLPVMT